MGCIPLLWKSGIYISDSGDSPWLPDMAIPAGSILSIFFLSIRHPGPGDNRIQHRFELLFP